MTQTTKRRIWLVMLLVVVPCAVAAQQLWQPRTAPNADGGAPHFLAGENEMLSREWLDRHRATSGGGSFGTQAVVADFWYDASTRRPVMRSAILHEVDDPADLRLGRAPGRWPSSPDFSQRLSPGTAVGTVGFDNWNHNGFTGYQAGLQGIVIDETRMGLCLSTAPARPGRNRAGSTYDASDLVCHVFLMPDGTLVLGYNTDPTTPINLVVRGNVIVEGTIQQRAAIQ